MFARVLLLTFALPAVAAAATYESGYGFKFELPDNWVVVTPQRLDQFKDKGLEIKGMKQDAAQEALKRVASGKIEYYFDRNSGQNFTTNISVRGNVRAIASTPDDAKIACERMPGQLKALYGDKVTVKRCSLEKLDGVPYMDYEYSGAVENVTTVQSEFQLTPNLALVAVGAADDQRLAEMRKGLQKVRQGISAHIKKSPDYFALLQEGFKAYKAGKFDQARKAFQPLADAGDPDGLYNLGVMHARGEGGPKEPAKAVQFYRRAAAMGSVDALTNLAGHYFYGDGVEKDQAEAARLYGMAAKAGVPMAQRYYGIMLIKGDGVDQDVTQGVDWLMQAALHGDEVAGQNLERLMKPQAQKDNASAMRILGLMYLQGVSGVKKDMHAGLGLLERAAGAGEPGAQKALARIYGEGLFGVAKDAAKADKWEKAAEKAAENAKPKK